MSCHPHGRARWSPVAAAGLLVVLAGCGADEPQPQSTVTVTATTAPTPEPTTEQPESGDVRGRRHDVGTVVDVREVAGQRVLVLDRWTVRGVADDKLAEDGVPVAPFTGDVFTNQNSDKTYAVPVAAGAVLVVNECQPSATPGGKPGLSSRRGDLGELLSSPDLDRRVLLLTYDDGQLVQVDTPPRCA